MFHVNQLLHLPERRAAQEQESEGVCRVSWTRDRPPLSLRIGWAGPTATWAEGTHATMNITASRPHASPRIARVDEGTVVSRETRGGLDGIRPVCCIPPPFHVKHAVATPPDSAASQRHLRATRVRVPHQAILDATPLPSPVHLTPSRGRRTQPHPPRWFSSCWACRSARRSASCSLGRPSHASARHPSWSTGPLGVITSMPSIGAGAGSGSAGLTSVGHSLRSGHRRRRLSRQPVRRDRGAGGLASQGRRSDHRTASSRRLAQPSMRSSPCS